MINESRCALHGPYTAEEAARLLLGTWTPPPTGYLCPRCHAAVSVAAKHMADRIDAELVEKVFREHP